MDSELDQQARDILAANDKGGYTVPNPKLYPFQWLWDSFFVALGFMTYNEPRAWQEIDNLFKGQWENGMMPHIIFHKEAPNYMPGPDVWMAKAPSGIKTSGITQPPIGAITIRKMLESAKDRKRAEEKVKEYIPKLLAFHRWFHDARDPNNTGLVAVLHPWETGRDNSPDWDIPLSNVPIENLESYQRVDTNIVDAEQRPQKDTYDRYMALVQKFQRDQYDLNTLYATSPFKVADTTINFILNRADHDLLRIAEDVGYDLGSDKAVIEGWIKISDAALEKLWNAEESMYECLDLRTGQYTGTSSSGGLVCFLARNLDKGRVDHLIEKLWQWRETVNYLVPSYSPNGSRFEPQRYWRGPVWAVVNFLIYEGLMDHGCKEIGHQIAADTAKVIKENGFCEYFNPITGEGLGGGGFSWTAAMWLAWLSPVQDL